MQMNRREAEGLLEFQVTGRLDAYWAEHFTTSVLNAVREGHRCILVDLSALEYVSSAGLGALLKCHKELRSLSGSFLISQASKWVLDTLTMTGLDRLLALREPDGTLTEADHSATQHGVVSLPNAHLEVYACPSGAATSCQVSGHESPWLHTRERQCRLQTFGESIFSIGLGAPGRDWADCEARMGEYLSAAGCLAYLPTDGGEVPDYLVSAERFVPRLQTLNSVSWQGTFTHLIRFEAAAGAALTLHTLAEQALAVVEADAAGLAMVGEIDGLVGAAWCRSPALAEPDTNPTGFPQVRDLLTFTAERAYARSSGLIIGIATRSTAGKLTSWVRPLGTADGPHGHCHAVAFSYLPLPRGVIDLNATVRRLFASESPRGLLHLLNDDRPVIGSGQSAFTSGACWVVPISAIDVENA